MEYTYKYPRPAVTADVIVVTREKNQRMLIIKRGREPFKGHCAYPGGFLEENETTEECAVRELEEETGIKLDVSDLTLLGVYSKVDRDPRGRTISVAYIAEVDAPLEVKGMDDADKAEWCDLSGAPLTAFDHDVIYHDVIEYFDRKLRSELQKFIHQDKLNKLQDEIDNLKERLNKYEK